MMARKKDRKSALELRGQLMLQTAAGRYFRPDVPVRETLHRRTLYTNAWLSHLDPVELPVGSLIGHTEFDAVSTLTIEALDKIEETSWDGSPQMLIATSGNELIDDIAYVMTFALNKTFSRDGERVRELVPHEGVEGRDRAGAALFPGLFEPRSALQSPVIDGASAFMSDLIQLGRDDFARVMRVIRTTVEATQRALDDPTGAYTAMVAALESLASHDDAPLGTWERYDGRRRKIFDRVLDGKDSEFAEQFRQAVLEADRAGLSRRFVASTLSLISPAYYREDAVEAIRAPRAAEVERMLKTAYDIRSRRTHVLDDLGREAWGFSDGAEVAFEPNHDRVFTLAGLWRLVRHVVRQFVAQAPKVDPEPWDYFQSLPGIVTVHLAPQYWIARDLIPALALHRLDGVADALIAWRSSSGETGGFDLDRVAAQIEQLVPDVQESDSKTAMIAIHRLWQEWNDPTTRTAETTAFMTTYEAYLHEPSPISLTVHLLSSFTPRQWSQLEWTTMANARHEARVSGTAHPLPAKIDVLIQLEAADQMDAAGQHDEALIFAARAVEELPGDLRLLEWEARLIDGTNDLSFGVYPFLFDWGVPEPEAAPETGEQETTTSS